MLLRKIFQIKKGETSRALKLFGYIFFLIASLLIVKPVSNALFIRNVGAGKLPLAFMLVALFSGILMVFYTRFSRRVSLRKLTRMTLLICSFAFSAFWLFFEFEFRTNIFYYSLYIFVAIYGVIAASQFWLITNAVLNAREAKRLFGFIGAGGISGGIFGGYLTSWIAGPLGSRNLLLISSLFLLFCFGFLYSVMRRHKKSQTRWEGKERRKEQSFIERPLKSLLKSRHLSLIAGIVGMSVLVATLADYQFRFIAAQTFTGEDDLTSFFGFWQSNLSIVALVVQLFLTGRVINKLGINTALFILPVTLLVGVMSVIFHPSIVSAVILKVGDGSFKQSFHKAGVELLCLPIPIKLKKQIKVFIDVFLDNLATGAAGLILFMMVGLLGLSIVEIGLLMVLFIMVWSILVVLVRNTYIQSFREAIENRTLDLSDPAAEYKPGELMNYLELAIDNGRKRQINYMLNHISVRHFQNHIEMVKKMLALEIVPVRLRAMEIAQELKTDKFKDEAHSILEGPGQDLKIEAMYYLFLLSEKDTGFLQQYIASPNLSLYWGAMICAARECEQDPKFERICEDREKFSGYFKEEFQRHTSPEDLEFIKIQLAKVIGTAKLPNLYSYLTKLLTDRNCRVVHAAITAAGKTRELSFSPEIAKFLGKRQFNMTARIAMENMGEEVIPFLEGCINDDTLDEAIVVAIPRVLSYIPSAKSIKTLTRVMNTSSLKLYSEIIRSLTRLKSNDLQMDDEQQFYKDQIIRNLLTYYDTFSTRDLLFQQDFSSDAEKAASILLDKALKEKLHTLLDLVFRILGLLYVPEDMLDAYKGVKSPSVVRRANAVEYIDNVIGQELKVYLMPVIESSSRTFIKSKQKELSNHDVSNEQTALLYILKAKDNWLKACTLYFMAHRNMDVPVTEISKLVADSNTIVKETARLTLARLRI